MGKRKYRAIEVKKMDWEKLADRVRGRRVAVGGDMAKEKHYGALVDAQTREVVVIWKWDQLRESAELVRQLQSLPAASLEVAIEPSGTYGDPFLALAQGNGMRVYQVSPKRSHDYAEVYDGVPSQHDGKSAVLLARMHLEGYSRLWQEMRPQQRELLAAVRLMDLYQDEHQRHVGRLEAQLARYWPELTSLLGLDTATLLELLKAYGDPAKVARDAASAAALMRRVGRLRAQKVAAILASAQTTIGVEMQAGECELMRTIAQEARRSQQALKAATRRVEKFSESDPMIEALAAPLGKATAAVLVATVGDPRDYGTVASYRKAYGLNLKVRSSGKYKGQLRITKRGPGVARQWLYMAVLRWLKKDPIARAWYERKAARDGGKKMRAIVALMRKLVGALWYVARGEALDSRKLFDVRRLSLAN